MVVIKGYEFVPYFDKYLSIKTFINVQYDFKLHIKSIFNRVNVVLGTGHKVREGGSIFFEN